MKLTKSQLRKLIKEELTSVTEDLDVLEISQKIMSSLKEAAASLDDLPESLFDEVAESGSPQRALFEAYENIYAAINELGKALDDSIIDGEREDSRHRDAMGKPFTGPGSEPGALGPLHPDYKK